MEFSVIINGRIYYHKPENALFAQLDKNKLVMSTDMIQVSENTGPTTDYSDSMSMHVLARKCIYIAETWVLEVTFFPHHYANS